VQQFPHFSAHVHYGQTAGWVKMPLGMEVGLGPFNIMILHILMQLFDHGDSADSRPRPHFLAYFALARLPISATAEFLLLISQRLHIGGF